MTALSEQTKRDAKLDQLIWAANLEDIGYGR